MAKKLKVELDVDNTDAKRKAKEVVDSANGTGNAAPSASTAVGPAANDAAKQIRNLGDAAEDTNVSMKAAVKMFSGMAIHLATAYAESHMKDGPGKAALEYAGNIAAGATAGAALGPKGAIIGAAAGGIGTFLKREGRESDAIEAFNKEEDRWQDSRKWAKEMRDLTDVEDSPVGLKGRAAAEDQQQKLVEKINEAHKKSIKLFDEENRLHSEIAKLLKEGKLDQADELKEKWRETRSRRSQVENIERSLETQKKGVDRQIEEYKLRGERRTSTAATDALQKIGGGSGEAGGRSLMTRLQEDGNRLLKDIANNTKTGGATWQ